jgi:hypothetical protein
MVIKQVHSEYEYKVLKFDTDTEDEMIAHTINEYGRQGFGIYDSVREFDQYIFWLERVVDTTYEDNNDEAV